MVILLGVIGIFIGALSGFFGVGGGMILVPVLLSIGFDIKTAIGISIVQMVFSSVYGSYLNHKKGTLILEEGVYVGIGGFIGGFIGGQVTHLVSEGLLQYFFFTLLLFALLRLIFAKKLTEDDAVRTLNRWLLLFIGMVIGIFAISLGVGGSILITPILVGFLHYPIKKAVSAGLFFVVFSSVAGLVSHLSTGIIDYYSGTIVAVASLVGVALGIWLKEHVKDRHHKASLVLLYVVALSLVVQKIFITH